MLRSEKGDVRLCSRADGEIETIEETLYHGLFRRSIIKPH